MHSLVAGPGLVVGTGSRQMILFNSCTSSRKPGLTADFLVCVRPVLSLQASP